MKKYLTIRVDPELNKKYKVWLAEREITMQEHLENFIKREVGEMKLVNKILREARKRKIEDLGWDAIFMEILDEEEAWEKVYNEIPEESKKELEEWWDETEYPDLHRFIVIEYLEREMTE